MVCRNYHRPAHFKDFRINFGDRVIKRFDRLYRSVKISGMPDHVAIREIRENKIIFREPLQNFFGDLADRHLRRRIKLWCFGRRYENPLFAFVRSFFSAVKKISNMGVFFGFRDMKLG